jgi:hypothetical protein
VAIAPDGVRHPVCRFGVELPRPKDGIAWHGRLLVGHPCSQRSRPISLRDVCVLGCRGGNLVTNRGAGRSIKNECVVMYLMYVESVARCSLCIAMICIPLQSLRAADSPRHGVVRDRRDTGGSQTRQVADRGPSDGERWQTHMCMNQDLPYSY